MNLKRQLLLVSLLTLLLPWAGCQFIRETESALRDGQQQMLAGTARAIADSLSRYREEFPAAGGADYLVGDQLYVHTLATAPEIDGYFDDWALSRESLRSVRGVDGPSQFALGLFSGMLYLFIEVADKQVVYATAGTIALDSSTRFADRVSLVSASPPYLEDRFVFAAEAPGPFLTHLRNAYGVTPEPRIGAFWQDVPGGYQIEARIPISLLATHLGIVVDNTRSAPEPGTRSATFDARTPGAFVTVSPQLSTVATELVQPGMRLLVTDGTGWRLASVGRVSTDVAERAGVGATWLRIAYEALLERGVDAELSEPDPSGREQQSYIAQALNGRESVSWYRSADSGRAVVAVSQPVIADQKVIGAVVLQQGTEAILSLRNAGLARLINLTLLATLLVAASLLGYATWLSRRIRRLSVAAEDALERDELRHALPSAGAADEVGDLSRSFSSVLRQLADYNDYLRTLASKLSHELRTPLAIVTSSLENLEHEPLNAASADYAARAKDGADRLRRILAAMSAASRVEELMAHADPEEFDLLAVLRSTLAAYRDIYPARNFDFACSLDTAAMRGSPELVIQLLDKLIDNAVEFSTDGDSIRIELTKADKQLQLTVRNPGKPLPELMRSQIFDSMVSVRAGSHHHLGIGLYVARLIAEGHGGSIAAANTDDGVCFTVLFGTRD